MTCEMPCTSMPRAATSVATSTFSPPRRNACSVRLRAPWCMSPCMAAAEWPLPCRSCASWSAWRLVEVKTMACSMSGWPRMDSSRRFLWPMSSAKCRRCSMLTWRVCAVSTAMRSGSCRNELARRTMLGSIVAENSIVWRVFGTLARMASRSSLKPMSSMRSASSSTRNCRRERSMRPEFIWSSMRPGVATRMSTPFFSMRFCSG